MSDPSATPSAAAGVGLLASATTALASAADMAFDDETFYVNLVRNRAIPDTEKQVMMERWIKAKKDKETLQNPDGLRYRGSAPAPYPPPPQQPPPPPPPQQQQPQQQQQPHYAPGYGYAQPQQQQPPPTVYMAPPPPPPVAMWPQPSYAPPVHAGYPPPMPYPQYAPPYPSPYYGHGDEAFINPCDAVLGGFRKLWNILMTFLGFGGVILFIYSLWKIGSKF
jgi:hypothetical protein